MPGHLIELAVVDGRPTVHGECDISNATQIELWLNAFDMNPVEVDLSGVTFFDSCALRAFLTVARRNPYLRIVEPSKAVRHVLDITGTLEHLLHGRDPLAARPTDATPEGNAQ